MTNRCIYSMILLFVAITACNDAGSTLDMSSAEDALVLDQGSPFPDNTVYPPDLSVVDSAVVLPDTATDGDSTLPDTTTPNDVPEPPTSEPEPELYPSKQLHSPVTQHVVSRVLAIASNKASGQGDVFMKVGASTTVSSRNLKCFADDDLDLGDYGWLQPTVDFFMAGDAAGTNPFSRTTKAAKSGHSAGWVISGDPSPLDEEIAAINPRFALIHYGTNDMGLGSTYESAMYNFTDNMMDMADQLVAEGIVPMFFAIVKRGDYESADRWVDTYNAIIRAIAQAHQVPFVDVHFATQELSGAGLASDGIHLNTYKESGSYDACIFTEEALQFGFNVRNLINLEALDRMRRALVLQEESDASSAVLLGNGSAQEPFLIEQLPFSDMRSTSESPFSNMDIYTGCEAEQDESGGEYLYRVELSEAMRLRAIIFDRGTVDVDIHLLDESATAEGCLQRDHRIIQGLFPAGTYTFSLDTFVSNSGPKDGPYLFLLLECHPEDSACDGTISP